LGMRMPRELPIRTRSVFTNVIALYLHDSEVFQGVHCKHISSLGRSNFF
jgi:hypothetical protein